MFQGLGFRVLGFRVWGYFDVLLRAQGNQGWGPSHAKARLSIVARSRSDSFFLGLPVT